MPTRLTESLPLAVTETDNSPGRLLVQLITPGWGSSGYYSDTVLENAATDKVWPAGTHIYFDHPSESEQFDRPERSVRDLAAILDEDAYVGTGGALVAETRIIGPYRELLTDPVFIEAVGMSIRASADTTVGEAEGRKGTIVTRLVQGESVDVVTHAGRGGRILAAVESARRHVGEATANDTRDALMDALRSAYGEEDRFVWARDFDDSTVWFDVDDADQHATYQQGYTLADDGTATLNGDRVEVRPRTEYVPVTDPQESTRRTPATQAHLREARNVGHWMESRLHLELTHIADDLFGEGHLSREERIALSSAVGDGLTAFAATLEDAAPELYRRDLWDDPQVIADAVEASHKPPVAPAGSTKETHESEEDTMPQIEESRLAQLEADAGRVQALETERDQARTERDEAREAQRATENREAARAVIAEADHEFTALEARGLMAGLPVTESGELDREKFTTAVTEAATEAQSASGAGTVRGFGHTVSTNTQTMSEAEFNSALGIAKEA